MSQRHIGLFAALALFVGLTVYQIDLPGLHYDEAYEVVPAMQLLYHQPVTTFRHNGVLLAGRLFPLMTQDYIGAINTYLAIPFLWLLGASTLSVRLMAVAIGLLTLWLIYHLGGDLGGPLAGTLTVLLLAVNPTFVFWSRQGVFVTSVTAAIGLGATLAWLRWWRTGAKGYAIVGALLLGLGLYAKLLFLWLIAGLGLAAVVLTLACRRQVRSGRSGSTRAKALLPQQGVGWRLMAWCILAFMVGAAPLIAYNVQTGGTLSSIGGNLTTSYYGINNLAFLPNLLERLKQFGVVLGGAHFWYLGGTYANWFSVVLFTAALVSTLLLAMGPAPDKSCPALMPFLVIAGVILASCATVSALWVTHFALVAPWPCLAVGTSAALLINHARAHWSQRRIRTAAALVLAFVAVSGAADVATDVRYHRALAVSGGLGAHSDAIDDMARWLGDFTQRQDVGTGDAGVRDVVAMDWGISAPVAFLTRGQTTPVEAFGYQWETDADLTARLTRFLQNPSSIYLWRGPEEVIFDRSDEFRQLYRPLGLEEDILEAFYERSGRPVLGVTRLVPQGTAVNPVRQMDGD
jgi:hypothetical protein